MMFLPQTCALLLSTLLTNPISAFGEGGSLPQDHFIYGPMKDVSTIEPRDPSPAAAVNAASCTYGPTSRGCWGNGYSVATDFDAKWPTTGVTRYYTLTIKNTTCAPDGSNKRFCSLVNNQFPGPTISANWGDMISVTVNNGMQDNGTGIHWHGIRQLGSTVQDGVSGITECPLAPGQSTTYLFQATQFGTSWYHSHHAAQYGDGVAGPIVIHGPSSTNFDVDMGPLTVSDWFYQSAWQVDELFLAGLQQNGPGPDGSNILINGTNKNSAGTTGKYMQATLTKGKTHRFRLINMSVDNAIRVSLDGHTMQLITADFVPIQPVTVDSVLLAIGQRYEVIITANQTPGHYWFRAEAEVAGCLSFNDGTGLAVFSYQGTKKATPTTKSTYTNGGVCEEPAGLVPWVVNTVADEQEFVKQASELDVSIVLPYVGTNNQSIVVWGINSSSMDVSWTDPTMSYVIRKDNNFPATANLIELSTEGTWVFWIIQEVQPAAPVPHPIHLHGHDFYVMGSKANAVFNMTTDPQTLQYTNPTRRDTAILPQFGWLVLGFPTDNPGAWLMHCHIAWHISEGLGVQFLEAPEQIAVPGSQYTNQCNAWAKYSKTSYWKKFGSGL